MLPEQGRFLAAFEARASRNGTASVAVGTRPDVVSPSPLDFSSGHSRPKGFERGRRWRADLAEKKAARGDWYPVGWHPPVMTGLREEGRRMRTLAAYWMSRVHSKTLSQKREKGNVHCSEVDCG